MTEVTEVAEEYTHNKKIVETDRLPLVRMQHVQP